MSYYEKPFPSAFLDAWITTPPDAYEDEDDGCDHAYPACAKCQDEFDRADADHDEARYDQGLDED